MGKNRQKFSLPNTEAKLWLWVFTSLCLTYLFLLCNFIWGNHDWTAVIHGNAINDGLVEGRFAQYILPNMLIMGQIFPLINMILGFACYALALTLLYTRFFAFKTKSSHTVILIAVALLPYINEILYFRFIILSQLFWPLLLTFSLLTAKKSLSSQKSLLWMILSAVLLFITIGGYPASINLYVTAALLYLTLNIPNANPVKKICITALPYLFSLILSFSALYIVHFGLQHNHQMLTLYNNQPLALKDLLLKIPSIYQAVILSLIQPQPYFNLSLKIVITSILIIFFIHEAQQKSALYKFCLYLVLPLCLKFSAWVVNENPEEYFAQHDPVSFMLRTDFYAIPVLLMFCLTTLSQAKNKALRNFTLLLTFFLGIQNCLTDINFSKIQKLGFDAEALLQQRINNRITETPYFNFNRNYKLIQAGELPLRQHYYVPQTFEKYGYYTLQIANTRHWLPSEFYAFYEPENFIPTNEDISPYDITAGMSEFLSHKITPWPSPDALYIDNNYIIIAITPEGKNMITKQFRNLGGFRL